MDVIRQPDESPRRRRSCWALWALPLYVTGCGWLTYEPYPAWTVQDIARENVPGGVLRAFEKKHSGSTILRIERSTLNSRNSGYPKLYRFTFTAADGQAGRAILDQKGRPSDLEFWFNREEGQ